MKKLLSLMLATIMTVSAFIMPTVVTAKESKKTPNSYVATNDVYCFGKGMVYTKTGRLIYEKKSGKKIVLEKYNWNYDAVYSYYVRGNTVYYLIYKEDRSGNPKNKSSFKIKSVNLSGKNKTTICSTNASAFLLGGYGSSIIYEETNKKYVNKIKKINNNKTTTLLTVKGKSSFEMFNGRIYYNNKAYNLKNGKTAKFVAKEIYVTKNYMYYMNKNNNLKSLDKKGTRRIVAKNVHKYYGANNGKIVIYSKLNNNNEEVFYKRTGTDKEYMLCSWSDMEKAIKTPSPLPEKYNYTIYDALFHKGKVYFEFRITGDNLQYEKISRVSNKGGTPEMVLDPNNSYGVYMKLYGDRLEYGEYMLSDIVVDD